MSTSNSSILKSRKPFITRPRTRMRSSCNGSTSGRNNNSNKFLQSKQNGKSRSNSSCSKPSVSVEQLESIREKLFQMKENESKSNENNTNDESSKSLSDFSTEELQQVFPYLRDYSHRKGCEEDYDNAQTAFSLSEDVLNELKTRVSNQNSENQSSTIESSEQSSFEEKWEKQFKTYNEETDRKRKELEKSHEDQMASFEKLWNEDMPRKYRKPSPHLLQIKKVEKSLALSCDFERAKQVHQEYEQLAAKELEQAQENLNRDYEAAHTKLVQKQQQEIKNFEEVRFHLLNLKKTKYEEQKAAFENRSRVAQTRKKEGQRNPKNNSDQVSNFTYSYSSTNENGNENSGSNNTENRDLLLLPELTPPNDPQYLEEDKKRKRELNKKKLAYQKQNAELTLARYTVDGQDFSNTSKSENEDKAKQENLSKSAKQDQDQDLDGEINQGQSETDTKEAISNDEENDNNDDKINQNVLQQVAIQVESSLNKSFTKEDNENNIQKDSIQSDNAQNSSIQSDNIQSNIAQDDNVQNSDVQNNNVQNDSIQSNAVNNNNVETAKISSNIIQDNITQSNNIQTNSIQNNIMQSNGVKTNNLSNNNIQNNSIQNNIMQSNAVKNNNVPTNNIQNNFQSNSMWNNNSTNSIQNNSTRNNSIRNSNFQSNGIRNNIQNNGIQSNNNIQNSRFQNNNNNIPNNQRMEKIQSSGNGNIFGGQKTEEKPGLLSILNNANTLMPQ